MKKRILTILSLVLIGTIIFQSNGLGLFDKKVAYAIGDLTVVWESTPLFNYNNIAPGFTVTKNVNVANGASSPRPVAVKGILTTDAGNMDSVMHIEIKEGLATLYSDTLEQFFLDSLDSDGIPLSTLAPSTDTDYKFIVTFNESAGNQYQNQSIVFDLLIGIAFDVPAECENIEFGSSAPIFGTSGNDRINGTSGNDLIFAFEGADKVFSHGGNDCIIGGPGNDELRGETQDDVIFGNEGDDIVIGAVGKDLLFGGSGNDTVKGENNDDVMFGNEGNDIMKGGNGDDQIDGNEGNDNINGENGSDQVLGSEDNDTLVGGNGADSLMGNDGIDSANGQNGSDTCDAETETNCEL